MNRRGRGRGGGDGKGQGRAGQRAGRMGGSPAVGSTDYNPVSGRGFGMGFGRGRGWRHMFYATGLPGWMRFGRHAPPLGYPAPYAQPDPEMERRALKNQAEALQSELDFIKKRLNEIEAEPAPE